MTLRLSLCLRSLSLADPVTIGCRPAVFVGPSAAAAGTVSSISTVNRNSRASPSSLLPLRSFHSAPSRLDFRLDPLLFSEPLKKKRRIDPMVLKKREDRIRGKIQAALDRLLRFAQQLKPVDEWEVPSRLVKEKEARTRCLEPLSFEESERRARLKLDYNDYTAQLAAEDRRQIEKVKKSQQRALAELRAESEELYAKAIEVDFGLLPLSSPVLTTTPPIAGYEAPDGEHADATKTFEYDVDFITVLDANTVITKSKKQIKAELKAAIAEMEEEEEKENKKKSKTPTHPPFPPVEFSFGKDPPPPPLNPPHINDNLYFRRELTEMTYKGKTWYY